MSVNKRPALRVDDLGIHAACCGTNTWQAKAGSETVFINGKSAHRLHDRTKHCGGDGRLIEGSPNVIVGDTSASPGGGPSTRVSPSSGTSPSSSDSSSSTSSSSAASSSSGASPDAIEPGIDPDPATLHAQAQADVLRAAAQAHMPFCEECERARTRSRP